MLWFTSYNRMANCDCSSVTIWRQAPQDYAVFDVLSRYEAFAPSPGAGEGWDGELCTGRLHKIPTEGFDISLLTRIDGLAKMSGVVISHRGGR